MSANELGLLVAFALFVVGAGVIITGLIKTKNDGHLEPLVWLMVGAAVLAWASYHLCNAADFFEWVHPLAWAVSFIALPILLALVTMLIGYAIYQAATIGTDVEFFGTKGKYAGGRQWDFVLVLVVFMFLFLGFTLAACRATLKEIVGFVPSINQGELRQVVSLANEIDAIRRDLGMENDLLEAKRNPFSIRFHEIDIQPAEQAKFTAKLNALLNPRGYLCDKVVSLRYEAPHNGNHRTGYCLVTACVHKANEPACLSVFRMAEPIGAGGVNRWAKDCFEGKLATLLEAMRQAQGSDPATARHIIEDALNDIPVGGGIDDFVVVPTR